MELERLEHIVLDGQQALNARNQLVLTMLNNGTRHADLTRRLNRVRAMRGAKNLTPHAVFALQRRLDSPRVSD
jgi:hypothetical protein